MQGDGAEVAALRKRLAWKAFQASSQQGVVLMYAKISYVHTGAMLRCFYLVLLLFYAALLQL
jgi:hypothetical protein